MYWIAIYQHATIKIGQSKVHERYRTVLSLPEIIKKNSGFQVKALYQEDS